jgi:hypothetical protein
MNSYPKTALIIAVIVYAVIIFNGYINFGIDALVIGIFIPALFSLATIDWRKITDRFF